ncbi:hypothetical protein [Streptomyces sp. NPDC003077]|uniref:hypothetical protein n=1 Tax=Streptomyces sp. NPDC003077 TaxID=3154443 RepID=UPI0033B599AA
MTLLLTLAVNITLRATGMVQGFSPWGLLCALPMFLVDRRLAAARREGERRVRERAVQDAEERTSRTDRDGARHQDV